MSGTNDRNDLSGGRAVRPGLGHGRAFARRATIAAVARSNRPFIPHAICITTSTNYEDDP